MATDVVRTGEAHGPDHAGCPTCDPRGGQPDRNGRRRPSVVRLAARGEEFKIVQLVGQLFVCSKANGSCCCGWQEKGRMPFDNSLWNEEWERRRIRDRVHLSFVGCLGPCAVGNSAMLVLYGRTIWLKDLNDAALAPLVYDWVESMLGAGGVIDPPAALRDHVWDRYLPAGDAAGALSFDGAVPDVSGDPFDGLDPVCLMSVDPATTRHRTDHDGHTYMFCSPACRKLFVADPESYLLGAAARPM